MNEYKTIHTSQSALNGDICICRCFGWEVKSMTDLGTEITVVLERDMRIPCRSQLQELEQKRAIAMSKASESVYRETMIDRRYTVKKAVIIFLIGLLIPASVFTHPNAVWVIKVILMLIGAGIFAYRKIMLKKISEEKKKHYGAADGFENQALELLKKYSR